MNKNIITIILGITLISLASATIIYSGEPYTLELEKPYAYYTIIGNTSFVNVSQEGNLAIISPDKYSNDNFTITFYGVDNKVIKHHSSSKRKVICESNWICSDWTDYGCYETRTCIDTNDCGEDRPLTFRTNECDKSISVNTEVSVGEGISKEPIEDNRSLLIILITSIILSVVLIWIITYLIIKRIRIKP